MHFLSNHEYTANVDVVWVFHVLYFSLNYAAFLLRTTRGHEKRFDDKYFRNISSNKVCLPE